MKKPLSGIKFLKLNSSHKYSVNDIKQMAVQEFTSDENMKLIDECIIQLGFFDGHPIKEFQDASGRPCGLWKYCKSKNVSTYRLNLYILTTMKIDDEDSEDLFENEDNVEEHGVGNESQQANCTEVEAASIASNQDDVRIFYHCIKQSKYSGEKSIVELEKDDLYLHMLSEEDYPNLSVDDFEPLEQGYSISRIEKSGRLLLQIAVDRDLKKSFHFPSANDTLSGDKHKIIHEMDELQGLCKGRFGLGIVPDCTDSCKPVVTWMKDGKVYKQGEFLYWINIEPEASDSSPTWKVTVSCQTLTDQSKSDPAQTGLNIAAEQSDATLPMVSSIPTIKKEQLKISKILLGAGAQGKVRKANWLGTDVAVKTIKFFNANLKLICRELNVLDLIRHPNIIQTMAICVEPKQVHIVMELFQGNSLSDVLFDDDIKGEYHLTIRQKNFIGNQICQAVSYLHCQANAIIHGDIKPDNILLNYDGIVKLCDLGLSKFTQMATALRSTVGTNTHRGTPIFMAPELFLEKSEATIYSDIWALACTLVELYSATSVWNLDDENQENALKEKLTSKVIPDLTTIPTDNELRGIIKTCFSHIISERATAVDLQKAFNSLL